MPQGIVASPPVALQEMAADHGPLTLGEARQLAQAIPEEMRRRFGCRCYKVMCAQDRCGCCGGHCIGCACPLQCCGCVWMLGFYGFLDFLIGNCFCVCEDSQHPGSFSCIDLKQNYYEVVPVAKDGSIWACFSESTFASQGEALPVCLYCQQ
mmetsp:Transcript_34878/g.79539  ORF Transcript_34878/g.79539 Transcript_34878/m.79539 type:complete len:152 (+) Transcript_34878:140-595(+)